MTLLEMTGRRFGRWTVVEENHRTANGRRACLCRCDCGQTGMVSVEVLRRGSSRSCGCLRRESVGRQFRTHGMKSSDEYRIWHGIVQRCTNPHRKAYPRYGGRGIKVCQRWRISFAAFYADMGSRPSSEHSIERIDNDGDYEPGNCRWATRAEQALNKRNNRLLTFRGRTQPVSAWARELRICPSTIHQRLASGWLPTLTLAVPVRDWGPGRPKSTSTNTTAS